MRRKINKVIKDLRKASRTHAKQANTLKGVLKNAAENLLKAAKENTLSVCLHQKQLVCQKDKGVLPFLERDQKHKVWVVNQRMLEHLQKEKQW